MKPNPNTAKIITKFSDLFEKVNTELSEIIKESAPQDDLIEVIRPEWVNPKYKDKIKVPMLYRFQQRNMRFYFKLVEPEKKINDPEAEALAAPFRTNDFVKFYPSVTTIIDKTMPMSYGKQKLIGDLGMKGYHQMMREKARYGTFLHHLITDYFQSGNDKASRFFDFDTIPSRIALFVDEKKIDFDTSDWTWQTAKDMASMMQFVLDYDVDPLAVEIVGVYDDGKYAFAGAMDLIAYMTIRIKGFHGELYKSGEKKGEPKESIKEERVLALVDFKSGKSGFFDDYTIQLHMYKLICEYSLGIKPERLFNVAPNDWEIEPTYSIKEQSDSKLAYKIPFLLGEFYVDYEKPNNLLIINGKFNGDGNLASNCRFVPAGEFLYNKLHKTGV